MRRVVDLLNAIADLREGDLLAVLELDGCTPLMDLGDDDTFKLDDDGRDVNIPGQFRPPKSLRHRVQTGQELANILLDHLSQVLGLGESVLPTLEKTPQQRSTDFGGRRFITCAARCGTRLA